MLNRREVMVRKLLSKFHDDPEILTRGQANLTFGFDPHLAERTRAKNPKAYSKEQTEWVSVDRVLHPEVCFYFYFLYIFLFLISNF